MYTSSFGVSLPVPPSQVSVLCAVLTILSAEGEVGKLGQHFFETD